MPEAPQESSQHHPKQSREYEALASAWWFAERHSDFPLF